MTSQVFVNDLVWKVDTYKRMIHIKHKKNRDIGHASTAFYVFHHIDDPL